MYLASSCPCCGGARFEAWPALTSPFLASYVLKARPERIRFLECDACRFRFFETRLTDEESERLYAGYRGDDYYRTRHRLEPWYTRKVNDAIGGDHDIVAARREMIEKILRKNVPDLSAIESVLDFGGDKGQVIPEGIGKERFVYEISGTHPVAGVSRIGDANELRSRKFDLVLLCHVLEHCSEPKAVLDEVRPLLKDERSILYVELPYERAELRWLGKSAGYRAYLGAMRHTGPVLTALDFYSTAFRIRLSTIPPLGFVKMHEHLNFFDVDSLRALFARSGFEPIAVEKVDVVSPLGPSTVLVGLARGS